MVMEDMEKDRQEAEALKLALISADPAKYVPLFFPAPAAQTTQNVEALIREIDQPETSIIDFELEPPPPEEAAEIISSLLADKGGFIPIESLPNND